MLFEVFAIFRTRFSDKILVSNGERPNAKIETKMRHLGPQERCHSAWHPTSNSHGTNTAVVCNVKRGDGTRMKGMWVQNCYLGGCELRARRSSDKTVQTNIPVAIASS